MKKKERTPKIVDIPTVYRYYSHTGKLRAKVAVGDVDNGVTVTAQHIAALHEFDADVQRQEWRDDKYIRRKKPIDRKTGKPLPEDKDMAYADWSASPEFILFSEKKVEAPFARFWDKLLDIIEQLQPQQQELIRQFFGERKTISQIARAEKVSPQAIHNRLTKLTARLKKLLEESK